MDDLAWTEFDLSPRIVARARAADPGPLPPVYAEMVQPTPAAGPPYRLIPLANVSQEDADPLLSDRVDDSFDALRRRTAAEMGWDYLARLSSSWVPLTYTPPSGHSRQSWHVCGRAIGLDREQVENGEPGIELVREDVGSITYWRIFARTARQDGSQGEPLRVPVWDLNARTEGGRAGVEGGALKRTIPAGYYVDLSDLAESYGWERASAMWRWRYSLPDVRWWELVKTGDLTWWDCMLEVFPPDEIVESFGPIPGHDE
jgi:TolB protein